MFTTFPAGWGKLTKSVGGKLRGSGLKPGMPDILIFFGGKTVGLELKAYGRSPSASQRTMFAQLEAAGIPVYVCFSVEEVMKMLRTERMPYRFRRQLSFGGETYEFDHGDETRTTR